MTSSSDGNERSCAVNVFRAECFVFRGEAADCWRALAMNAGTLVVRALGCGTGREDDPGG